MKRGVVVAIVALIAALVLLPRIASARVVDGGETQVFHNRYVAPGEVVHGDLTVVFGDAVVAGLVTGDCTAVFGSCRTVDGGQILGEENDVSGDAGAYVPWIHRENPFADQDHRLVWRLAWNAVVVVMFLLFPLRMRMALDRIEQHPGSAAVVGTIAAIALIPLAIALVISIVGIPLVALEVAAFFAGAWIGTGALALLIGRRLTEMIVPRATPSPLLALVVGLVVVSAAEIVPVLGWIVTALVWLLGLGAAVLSFLGPAPLGFSRPIAGPPMSRRF